MYENEFGKKYGKLLIIRDGKEKYKVLCKCDCGNVKEIKLASIKYGSSKSCGCSQKEIARGLKLKYDVKISKGLHRVYKSMRTRCYNKNCKSYKDYGGRGIKVERNKFEDFYNDMANTYRQGLTIERINNSGNYCKENCKRITKGEQSRNRRNVKKVLYQGKYYIIPELSEMSGIGVETIRRRLKKGRAIEDILHIKNKYKGQN